MGGGLAPVHVLQLVLLSVGEGQPTGARHGLALGAAGGRAGDAGRVLPCPRQAVAGVAHHLLEHLPEAGGHQVVEDGVGG